MERDRRQTNHTEDQQEQSGQAQPAQKSVRLTKERQPFPVLHEDIRIVGFRPLTNPKWDDIPKI